MTAFIEKLARAWFDAEQKQFGHPRQILDYAWKETSEHYVLCVRAVLQAAREPSKEQIRALIVHRGYDPDAKEDTLDVLGNIDLMTMGAFMRAYTVMIDAALSETPIDAGRG